MFEQYPRSRKFLKDLLSRQKKRWLVFLLQTLISTGLSLLLPYVAKLETDQLVAQDPAFRGVVTSPYGIFVLILWIGFVIELFQQAARTVLTYFQNIYEDIFETTYFMSLYHRLKHIELGIYANPKNQDLFSKILWETRLVRDMFQQVWEMASLVLFVIWSFGLLYTLDWKIALWLAVGWVSYYFLYLRERKLSVYKKFDTRDLERGMKTMKRMTRDSYHKLVAIWASDMVLNTMQEFEDSHRKTIHMHQRKKDQIAMVRRWVDVCIRFGIKAVIGRSIFQATASVWSLAMTVALLSSLSWYVSNLVRTKQYADDNKEKLAMLELYLDATHTPDGWVSDISFDKITLCGLRFAYPTFTQYELKYFDIMLQKLELDDHLDEHALNKLHALQEAKKTAKEESIEVLHGLDCEFSRGSVYGIVWKNGAGKTTLMHLLMSYFNTYTGDIYRWDYKQWDLSFDHFEDHISVIEQEPFLLRWFSIRDNILAWVSAHVTDDYLYELLWRFGLDKVIREYRKWLDTIYSYDCNFSWWQEQLISLIRVYLQDKQVMILDEWTNQLDAENESKIMQMLLENKQDKIIIMISHRMTTLQKADYLYCLEKWTITDQWSPTELRNQDSLFAKFWDEQVG